MGGFDKLVKAFKSKPTITANKFLNIKDIQGNFLYTIDGKVLAYLKIYPKNCKLMSKEEQKNHAQILTRNFASELKPFKLYFTNRPVNLQRNQDYQAELMDKEKNATKFTLQSKRSRSFGNLSVRGKALESEIYLIVWGENTEYIEQELMKRLNDLKMKFTNSGYRTEILEERLIIQLVNSYTNPDVAYIENQDYLESPLTVI
ncbi:MAG TPA: hypothetical protein DCZ30_01970 [Clostridiales bacterium]|nr:hypothetical protein [Clostridiales bacterium]